MGSQVTSSVQTRSVKLPVNGIRVGGTVRFKGVPVDFDVVAYSEKGRGGGWP